MPKRNERDVEWTTYDEEGHVYRRKQLSEAAGADQLGCSLYELEPGNRSWPYHYHTANEEAIYVLSGRGRIRLADEEDEGTDGESTDLTDAEIRAVPLEAGDYVSCPADESGGHQVVNDGDEPLRYLALSTMAEPDVTVYPEKGTFGVYVGSPPGRRDERLLEGYYPLDADEGVDYWKGVGDAAEDDE